MCIRDSNQRDHQPRTVRRSTHTPGMIDRLELRQVEFIHDFHDTPHQMILREQVTRIHREQEDLVTTVTVEPRTRHTRFYQKSPEERPRNTQNIPRKTLARIADGITTGATGKPSPAPPRHDPAQRRQDPEPARPTGSQSRAPAGLPPGTRPTRRVG